MIRELNVFWDPRQRNVSVDGVRTVLCLEGTHSSMLGECACELHVVFLLLTSLSSPF